MNNSHDGEIEQDPKLIDWNELMGESPKSIEFGKIGLLMTIILIFSVYLMIHSSIWGLWADGDQ